MLDDGTTYAYCIERISQTTGTDTEYFLRDALGSVRQVADGGGAIRLVRNYDLFGNVEGSWWSGESVFRYTGEEQDSAGKVYLRARY